MPPGAVILAGGLGVRLGQDKAHVKLGGETLLERAVRRMLLWTDSVVVVGRPDQHLVPVGARVVSDLLPYSGVLAGIVAGLNASERGWNVVVACDMPFVDSAVLELLSGHRNKCDVVVPHLRAGYEPLHAMYHRRCVQAILGSLESGQRRVRSFYESVRVCEVDEIELLAVDPGLESFVNINTPDELLLAQQRLFGR